MKLGQRICDDTYGTGEELRGTRPALYLAGRNPRIPEIANGITNGKRSDYNARTHGFSVLPNNVENLKEYLLLNVLM
jgi:hypothetical protein